MNAKHSKGRPVRPKKSAEVATAMPKKCVDDLSTNCYVDPDPYTIAAVWIAAASLILQFVQFAREFVADTKSAQRRAARTPLERQIEAQFAGIQQSLAVTRRLQYVELEQELREIDQAFDRLLRAMERGSRNIDQEFYDVPFRIGVSALRLDTAHHHDFVSNLGTAYSTLGGLALRINLILSHNDDEAALLGQNLQAHVADATKTLNELLERGAQNRRVVFEAKKVIDAAIQSIRQILDAN